MKKIFLLLLCSVVTSFGQWEGFTNRVAFNTSTTTSIHGATGSTETFDWVYSFHTATLDSATVTVSFSGDFASGQIYTMTIRFLQDATGGRLISWPNSVISAPTINPIANSITHVTLETSDAGVTFYAFSDFTTTIPQLSKSTAYTTTALDAGGHIYHPSTDNSARIFTIDSNANVKYLIGTTITFVNEINTVTISITSDTLTLQGANTTGSVDIPAGNTATALKVSATKWVISGTSGVVAH